MNKERIRLLSSEEVKEFVGICSKYSCDINVYRGSAMVADAKSILGMMNAAIDREVYVQIVSSNEDIIVNFLNDIKKYKV